MPLDRSKFWQTDFHRFLDAERGKPFAWGTNDCSIFAANAIRSFTGTDIADDFRGRYKDEASAFELIKNVTDGATVADAAAHCAQKHELIEWTSPKRAQRGDLVLLQDGPQVIAGVVGLDGRYALSVNDKGIVPLLNTNIIRAWRV